MKKRRLSREANDAALLRDALADVVPLPEHGRVVPELPKTKPVPVQRLRDERAALADSLTGEIPWDIEAETGEELLYVREGLSRQVLKKLRRGHWVTQDELDLHGHTAAEAHALLADFLAACKRGGRRCVRIVHGKGLGSKNREPVLKGKVAKWLAQRDEVLAFCQARGVDGGSGAVMVLLKSQTRQA